MCNFSLAVHRSWSFNTPEGVEGFSSGTMTGQITSSTHMERFNTPEGVEGFSSGRLGNDPELRYTPGGFNTPEGVEGFSRKAKHGRS